MNAINVIFPKLKLSLPLRLLALLTGQRGSAASADYAHERRFMKIVEESSSLISRLCYYYSSSAEDFEDLRQDCLINIWRGLSGFDERSALSTWIYRVCINTCITSFRQDRRRGMKLSLDSLENVAEENGVSTDDIETLHYLISQLPLIDRGIVMMWLDGKSNDEIAQVTGLTRNNVAVRFHRSKERMAAASKKI